LDSKDFLLLVGLHENARQSYRSLGRKASLSAPAVRDRIKRLESRGIINGFWLSIAPRVFGLYDTLVFFQGDFSKKLAEKVLVSPDVAWVAVKLDRGLTVQLWTKEARPVGSMDNLEKIAGVKASSHSYSEYNDLNRLQEQKLTSIDWQIMDRLIDQPLIPFGDLVNSTSLSAKTVRKHLQELLRREVMYVLPKLGALADSGDLVFLIAINGKVSLSSIREIFREVFLMNQSNDPPTKFLLCRGTNLGDMTTKIADLYKLDGVESATVSLNKEILINTKFMHLLISKKNLPA
jgi:DNA-binding Lrp family transcriptional regulator